jgi:transcriptional regulator with XRE-family HTH domain
MPKSQADKLDVQIGRRIQKAREAQDIGRPTLAERVGLSAMAIYKFETGRTRIVVSVLAKIAKALKRPVSDFLPKS